MMDKNVAWALQTVEGKKVVCLLDQKLKRLVVRWAWGDIRISKVMNLVRVAADEFFRTHGLKVKRRRLSDCCPYYEKGRPTPQAKRFASEVYKDLAATKEECKLSTDRLQGVFDVWHTTLNVQIALMGDDWLRGGKGCQKPEGGATSQSRSP